MLLYNDKVVNSLRKYNNVNIYVLNIGVPKYKLSKY